RETPAAAVGRGGGEVARMWAAPSAAGRSELAHTFRNRKNPEAKPAPQATFPVASASTSDRVYPGEVAHGGHGPRVGSRVDRGRRRRAARAACALPRGRDGPAR